MPAPRLLAPLAGLVLALVLYPGTRGLDAVARGSLGPGFWPRLALIGLGLGCVAKLVEEWRRASASPEAPRPPLARARLGAGIAALVLYAWLAPLLGFAITTAVFVAAFMALAGTRSVAALAATASIGTVALLYVFVKLVYLPLPKGDGPFETLTLALYRALRLF